MLAFAAIQIAIKDGESQSLLKHPVMGEMIKIWTLEEEGVGYASLSSHT